MSLFYKKIIFSMISLGFLILPILVYAQAPGGGAAGGQSAPAGAVAPDNSVPAGANKPDTGAPGGDDKTQKNAAENIDVKLQVPLPFVKLTGGKVANLKDYIEGVYKFLIGAGALLAVVMFIVAGYQWMISGGSADKTGAAKKRMWAAAMGLVLALLSFVILQTINEKLVKLELPKIEPVPPYFFSAEESCQDSQALKDYEKNNKISDGSLKLTPAGSDKPISRNDALCGTKYTVEKNLGQCNGEICLDAAGQPSKYACIANRCKDGLVYGKVKWENRSETIGFTSGYLKEVAVVQVCKSLLGYDGYVVSRKPFDGRPTEYVVPRGDKDFGTTCPVANLGGYAGYSLVVSAEGGWFSFNKKSIVGRNCAKALYSTSIISYSSVGDYYSLPSDLKREDLIPYEELSKGFECNIDLSDPSFKP